MTATRRSRPRWGRLPEEAKLATRTRKAKVVAKEEPLPEEPGFEEIATRAYTIHESGEGGDAVENWLRAERELLGPMGAGIQL